LKLSGNDFFVERGEIASIVAGKWVFAGIADVVYTDENCDKSISGVGR